MPPEASDVAKLMKEFVTWLNTPNDLPWPILAGIAHYQFATIHPYFDGNGRTARLLTTLLLHRHGYSLKGLYCLEEYYAHNLSEYYDALSIGPSHNYYMGREEADITSWVEYFCKGMAEACRTVQEHAQALSTTRGFDYSHRLRTLDPRQRRVMDLFTQYQKVSGLQIAKVLGIGQRSAHQWCMRWVEEGFLIIANPARKSRSYALAPQYEALI